MMYLYQETDAYLAADSRGLQILDISNPFSPSLVTFFTMPESRIARTILLKVILYLLELHLTGIVIGTIYIISITDLFHPEIISTIINTLGAVTTIQTSGELLYFGSKWEEYTI